MKFSKMMYGLVFVFLCTVSVFAENGTETVPGIEGSYSDPDNNQKVKQTCHYNCISGR